MEIQAVLYKSILEPEDMSENERWLEPPKMLLQLIDWMLNKLRSLPTYQHRETHRCVAW